MGVNLSKGQRISLAKEAGAQLSKVVMGLGWDGMQKNSVVSLASEALRQKLIWMHLHCSLTMISNWWIKSGSAN